jgi:hypothetical protein
MIFTEELLFEAKCPCLPRRKPQGALHLQIVSRIFWHPGQCREGGKSKNFSIEHLCPAESKSSHQASGRSARRSEIITCYPLKYSLLNVTKKGENIIQLGQKRSSMIGLLLDSHRIQERRKKREYFLYWVWWAIWRLDTIGGTNRVLRLKEI